MNRTRSRLGRLDLVALPRPLLALGLAGLALAGGLASHELQALVQEPASQDPAPVEGLDQDPGLPEVTSEEPPAWQVDEQWQGLFGTWQLMQFDHSNLLIDTETISGYMQIGEGFLSMVIHARNNETDDLPSTLGQAGMHRWQIVRGDILQTATMMGHSNFGEDFEWETPNTPREFRVLLQGDDLQLTRPDLSRLMFRRLQPGEFPEIALERILELRAGGEEGQQDL